MRGKEKYIYHFGNQKDELFDLEDDPRERNNFAGNQEADKIEERRDELLAWRSKANEIYTRHPDETRGTAETEG